MAQVIDSNILEGISDIFFRLDEDARVLYINPAWGVWTGVPPEQIQGKSFLDQLPEGEQEAFQEAVEALRNGEVEQKKLTLSLLEKREDQKVFEVFMGCSRPEGGSSMIEGLAKLSGERSSNGPGDIFPERKAAYSREREHRVALFTETAPLPLIECDEKGAVSYSNPKAEELIQEKGIPRALDALPENHEWLAGHVFRSGKAAEREKSFEGRVYKWHYSLAEEPGAVHIRGYDVTAQKQMEADLLDAVVRTQEAERERFAQELHEGIGQYLSAILMEFEGFKNELDYEQQKKADDIERLVQKVMRDVRSVSKGLMPPMLKEFGLGAALEELLYEKERTKGLETSLSIDPSFSEERMEEKIRIGLYRIAEDLLDHSVQMRKAKKCSFKLLSDEGHVVLEKEDEADLKEAATNGSLRALKKLDSMIRSMNGNFDLIFEESTKPTVRIRVPLR